MKVMGSIPIVRNFFFAKGGCERLDAFVGHLDQMIQ